MAVHRGGDAGEPGAEQGLGVVMVQAASRYQVDVVFAGLIVFAVLSLILTGMVKLLEDRLSRWRPRRLTDGS